MAAAVPIAMMIGSAIASKKAASAAGKSARKTESIGRTPTPEEQEARAGTTRQAGKLGGIGETLYGQGAGSLGRASSYYEALLGRGGRGAMESAVAPAAESISDLYGGVSRSLEGSNVRGGVRDMALAEAEREKRGRISRLTAGVQPGAASALTGIGKFQQATGAGATAKAGGLYSSLVGSAVQGRSLGLQGRLAGEKHRGETGQDIGNLLFSVLSSQGGGGKSGGRAAGGAGLPSLGGAKYGGLPIGG